MVHCTHMDVSWVNVFRYLIGTLLKPKIMDQYYEYGSNYRFNTNIKLPKNFFKLLKSIVKVGTVSFN